MPEITDGNTSDKIKILLAIYIPEPCARTFPQGNRKPSVCIHYIFVSQKHYFIFCHFPALTFLSLKNNFRTNSFISEYFQKNCMLQATINNVRFFNSVFKSLQAAFNFGKHPAFYDTCLLYTSPS